MSLLKPLRAGDDDLERNIESFYRLDYPGFEVLFAVDADDDPCTAVVRRLAAKYPHIQTTILVTGNSHTENPKIHKLARLEPLSRGELLWVTDSNIRAESDTLIRLVETSRARDAKIVFSPIRGTSSRRVGSLMDNTGLNFFTSGSIMSAWAALGQPIVVGKSMLIDRAVLDRFGGFAYFKDYLAEDFLIGETFFKSGYTVALSRTWVTNVSRMLSVRGFYDRMVRWAKLRFHLKKPTYFCEILLNPIIMSLFGAAILTPRAWPIPAAAAALKVALEYANFLAVNVEDRKKLRAHLLFPFIVIGKDLILFAVYLAPIFSRKIHWRKETIGIGRMTLITLPQNVDRLVHEGA